MPHADVTGLWHESPYYIGEYETIRKDHDESLAMIFCGMYILVGIYHFLIFLSRPVSRDNLCYCFFSILMAVYFLARSNAIYKLIPDSDIIFRIEYISLYLLVPMLSTFLEHLNFGKTTKINRIYMAISLFFAGIQIPLPNSFGDDLLYVWWIFVFFEIAYIIGYDILYVFYRNIQARRKAAKYSPAKAFWESLAGTSLGNILVGVFFLSVTAASDVLRSIYMGYGIVDASRYGIFIFTILTAVILARRFGRLFRRVDEMNVLLEKSNLNLEATVRERTRELERQTEVAKSASQAKSKFLARMSHEIRTPLNGILGLSEVELQKDLPRETRLNLEKVYHSGSHLLEIVNDILDISKIESGNFEIFPVEYDFPAMINDTVQLNMVRIGIKPIEFRLDIEGSIPRRLFGDDLRLKQILNNLLSNAFKYTEEGKVCFSIGWEQAGDDARLNFVVEDTGRGIKKQDLEKLFSEYTQFEAAANRKIEGTGLGLSIAKGLVDRMGGSITVESEYGKGSIFRVSLPQGIVDKEGIGEEVVENLRNFRFIEGRNRNRGDNFIRSWMPYGKVLVVDDIQTNLDVMSGLLMPYGLKVQMVSSGREAVEAIRRGERYDLVFMDHMMPEMDGTEAARIIREELGSEYARKVPIVALTANAIAGNREIFLANGFNDFISKPIDIKRLDVVLNQWVRDKQSEETLREAEVQTREQGSPGREGAEAGAESRWLLEHPVEGVDFEAALALYGNSLDIYLPILRSFVVNSPLLLEKMDKHLAASLGEYAIEVHGLKGACNAICAGETAALARELELASKEGRLDFVQGRHGELWRQVMGLTGRLKGLLDEREAGKAPEEKEGLEEPDRELLSRLSVAAEGFSLNDTEEILGELERFRYERGEELIRWLREQAENFDYEAMHKRLEEFLGNG
jgi:signal transduction histidine kinase/FixJ family two-component response regulator/HPt (histidine-containing phosphotransfer) domain-containing protein